MQVPHEEDKHVAYEEPVTVLKGGALACAEQQCWIGLQSCLAIGWYMHALLHLLRRELVQAGACFVLHLQDGRDTSMAVVASAACLQCALCALSKRACV